MCGVRAQALSLSGLPQPNLAGHWVSLSGRDHHSLLTSYGLIDEAVAPPPRACVES